MSGVSVENGSGTAEKGQITHITNGAQPINRAVTPGGHILDQTQPAFPVYHRKFANPAPLGLTSFAATTFLLSLINVQARDINTNNIIIGLALGYGGLCQLLAGMWEFAAGNTFGATAFSSYGGFWISFAVILWPSSGIVAAYEAASPAGQLSNALGLYLGAWFIFTFIMLLASLRSSIGLIALFFCLDLTFMLLMIGFLYPSENATKAGGSFGILTSAIAWYVAAAGLLTPETSHFVLPVGNLARAD